MFKEFKEFAIKGSVLDMAVGIIMGAAFGGIVTSFVKDILMPPIGLLLGRVDFANLFINLSGTPYPSLAAAQAAGAPTINYGVFLNLILSFIIVAFVVFLFIRQVNRMRKAQEAPADTKECPFCLSSINVKAVRCPQCTSQLETT